MYSPSNSHLFVSFGLQHRWRRRHLHKLDAYPATASSSLSGAWQIVVAVAVAAVAFMAALVLAALIWLRPVIQAISYTLPTTRNTTLKGKVDLQVYRNAPAGDFSCKCQDQLIMTQSMQIIEALSSMLALD